LPFPLLASLKSMAGPGLQPKVNVPSTPPHSADPAPPSRAPPTGPTPPLANPPRGPATPPRVTLPLSHSTPLKIESSTICPFTTNQKFRIPARNAMGEEIRKFIVGPMPAQQFLDDFFPLSKLPDLKAIPTFTANLYDRTVTSRLEVSAYDHFVSPFGKHPLSLSQVSL
jgi:hypothetical protein